MTYDKDDPIREESFERNPHVAAVNFLIDNRVTQGLANVSHTSSCYNRWIDRQDVGDGERVKWAVPLM